MKPPIIPDSEKVNFSQDLQMEESLGMTKVKERALTDAEQTKFSSWDWTMADQQLPKEWVYVEKQKKSWFGKEKPKEKDGISRDESPIEPRSGANSPNAQGDQLSEVDEVDEGEKKLSPKLPKLLPKKDHGKKDPVKRPNRLSQTIPEIIVNNETGTVEVPKDDFATKKKTSKKNEENDRSPPPSPKRKDSLPKKQPPVITDD